MREDNMKIKKIQKVDVTPPGNIDDPTRWITSLIGTPYKSPINGEVVGEIKRVKLINGRLIAEVLIIPKVILG